MNLLKHLALSALVMFVPLAHADYENVIDTDLPNISYVTFPSTAATPLTIAGQLKVPANASPENKVPAVVVVHGSGGVDSRGKFYVKALNKDGIATLEIDMWAARGFLAGGLDRPSSVQSTLPDVYGALQFLASRPNIDASRIGIMGFSWGGVLSMLTATNVYSTGPLKFAAHVAHYPICWAYVQTQIPGFQFKSFTGAPVLIQTGDHDDYDNPVGGPYTANVCKAVVQSLPAEAKQFIKLRVYKNATHGWDRLQPAMTVNDPYAHLGLGLFRPGSPSPVQFTPSPEQAYLARYWVEDFFMKALSVDPAP